MVDDVTNINLAQKFAGSCAIKDEMAKNATWKDHKDEKVNTVQIESSSSLLRSQITYELGHETPQASWDFKTLSSRRAQEIKNKIRESYGLRDEQLATNSSGSNGNGTSGACPYKLVKKKNEHRIWRSRRRLFKTWGT